MLVCTATICSDRNGFLSEAELLKSIGAGPYPPNGDNGDGSGGQTFKLLDNGQNGGNGTNGAGGNGTKGKRTKKWQVETRNWDEDERSHWD